jgi:hypothetical protein
MNFGCGSYLVFRLIGATAIFVVLVPFEFEFYHFVPPDDVMIASADSSVSEVGMWTRFNSNCLLVLVSAACEFWMRVVFWFSV